MLQLTVQSNLLSFSVWYGSTCMTVVNHPITEARIERFVRNFLLHKGKYYFNGEQLYIYRPHPTLLNEIDFLREIN